VAPKDYYSILGVSRTETARGIQNTFHDLVKRLHRNRLGPQGTAAFQDLVEAYQVLSDPERRKAYRHHLLQTETAAQRAPVPRRGWDWPQSEPLIPEWRFGLREFLTIQPSFDALQARLQRNFTGVGVPKGERVEGLNVEICLWPEEARRGGVIHLGVPIFSRCRSCAGRGREWGFMCLATKGGPPAMPGRQ
jgi:DnaJ-class molecular chaperone